MAKVMNTLIGSALTFTFAMAASAVYDRSKVNEFFSRTTAHLSMPDGLYEVRLAPYGDSKRLPHHIHVKRAFSTNSGTDIYPVLNKTVYGATYVEDSYVVERDKPAFKEAILRASCQLASTYMLDPIEVTPYTLLATSQSLSASYLEGTKNFYKTNCIN